MVRDPDYLQLSTHRLDHPPHFVVVGHVGNLIWAIQPKATKVLCYFLTVKKELRSEHCSGPLNDNTFPRLNRERNRVMASTRQLAALIFIFLVRRATTSAHMSNGFWNLRRT